jgi:hypothetical protein
MKCLFTLHRECRVVSIICSNDAFKDRCIDLTSKYATEVFIKVYCAMCVKSIYAKAKKHIRMTVVNTL